MLNPRGVVILVALKTEAAAIRRALKGCATATDVRIVGLRASRLTQIPACPLIIVAGLAGALDPSLRAGDLVLDTPISGLPKELPWRIGAIHTATRLISTPADKAALFRETGAIAVDMEQALLCRAAQKSTRIIGIRAISDPAHMAIDPAVLQFINDIGQPRPVAIASAILRRPSLIPHLRELGAHSRLALRNLGLGVRAIVDSGLL